MCDPMMLCIPWHLRKDDSEYNPFFLCRSGLLNTLASTPLQEQSVRGWIVESSVRGLAATLSANLISMSSPLHMRVCPTLHMFSLLNAIDRCFAW